MYKVFLTTQPAGFPIELDNFLAFQQQGYNNPMEALGKAFGNMVIIDGATQSGNPDVVVAPGFGIVNNELVYFEGGALQSTFYLTTDTATLIYQGGEAVPVLQTRIARFGVAATLQFNFADLRYIQAPNSGLIDRILKLEKIITPLLPYPDPANPDNTVYGSWLFWGRPAGEIPAGWEAVPDETWQGAIPVLLNAADPDFATVGQTGGVKTVTLGATQLPATMAATMPASEVRLDAATGAPPTAGVYVLGRPPASGIVVYTTPNLSFTLTNAGGGQPVSVVQPYKVVMFIQFVG
jgi:hypothetical protein